MFMGNMLIERQNSMRPCVLQHVATILAVVLFHFYFFFVFPQTDRTLRGVPTRGRIFYWLS